MQLQNFYSDWLPASSSPLDNIVLSPHTINPKDDNLNSIKEDYCESPSRLCAHDLYQFAPLASTPEKSECACQLKKCFNWFRNRYSDKKEIQ